MRPIAHNDQLPIPKPPDNEEIEMENDEAKSSSASFDINYAPDLNKEPHLINQEELNNPVRDLNLSKKYSQLLGSTLQGWNLFLKNTYISIYRDRHKNFSIFFPLKTSYAIAMI